MTQIFPTLLPANFNPTRILVRGVNWLGDAVMTTPALLRLREKFPQSHIAILTLEKIAALYQEHPAVNEIITISQDDSPWQVGKKIKPLVFDLGIILPNSPRSALEIWFGNIPTRIGYHRPWRNWFLTHTVPERPERVVMQKKLPAEIQRLIQNPITPQNVHSPLAHQVFEYLHLMAVIGTNPAVLSPLIKVGENEVTDFRTRLGNFRGPLLGMIPGAEYGPAKRWPVERFIAAALEVQRKTHCGWILFGGKGDQSITSEITAKLITGTGAPATIWDLAGKTTLRELCAGLKQCQAVLTNDTGPMHLAAALGTPLVALFGSTSPALTAPGLPGGFHHALLQVTTPCNPCFLRECPIDFRCMTSISVEQVVEAMVKVLK